jgi:hypothetical protein
MVLSAIVGNRTKSFERVEAGYQLLKLKPVVKRLLLSFRPRQGLGMSRRLVDRSYENYLFHVLTQYVIIVKLRKKRRVDKHSASTITIPI